MEMFCYQCEQTAKGTGCTKVGVCGKNPETAALQDQLINAAKEISTYAHNARGHGAKDAEIDRFILDALFSTVTNVNFDPERLEMLIETAGRLKDKSTNLHNGSSIWA